MEKKINYQFKILYFFGILFIVACHCSYGGISLGYEWFYPGAFHLALFAFGSGYFYKTSSEDHILAYIWKKFKHLMADLKAVYAAVDEQAALDALDTFGERWDKKYPKISQSWHVII